MPLSPKSKAAADDAQWAADLEGFAEAAASAKKKAASPKPASPKPAAEKPAAKQPTEKKAATKRANTTLKRIPKRKEVLLPGPHEKKSSSESDTDTPNPGLITGDEASSDDGPKAPGATKSGATPAAEVDSIGTADPSEDPAPPAETPKGRPPSPEDPSLQVDYEESASDNDREAGEVEDPSASPQLTGQQRVLHPGSPMTPKTAAAVARAKATEKSKSRRDASPAAEREPQVITNAGIDEGVPPELLQLEIRQHLSERSRQVASQASGGKRAREANSPRTRDELLALRYWTREEYREHLRQSRRPEPGAPQCDKCPVVLLTDNGLARQRNETEFKAWVHHLGYPHPEFLESPYLIDWLAQRRLRFRMAKMIADDTWSGRFLDRHKPFPGGILEEVIQKIQKSWQSQPIEPMSVLGSVSADQLRGHAQKRPRGRRSPPRGDHPTPTSYNYSGSHATSPGTGTDRYARGASVSSRHGSRGRPHYQAEEAEPATGVVSDQDAQRRSTGSRPDMESLLTAVEACQRLLDGQRANMVALRARVQAVEAHVKKLQDVPGDLDVLRNRVWDLPGRMDQLGDEVGRLRHRCSPGEQTYGQVRHDLGDHLGWIRDLYDRVARLETQERHRSAAPAPAPAPAPVPQEELVRLVANAFRQYSATQDQQPTPGDKA